MTKPIKVPANEFNVVRVFSLSMSDTEARQLSANIAEDGDVAPLELALGSDALNEGHIEVLMLADLGDMSLADYLIEGAGVPSPQIDADKLKLSALDGWVMIVYSSAFQGAAQVLNPGAALTLVATYDQEPLDWTAPVDLSTPSALPNQAEEPQRKAPSDAAMSGRVAMLALIVAFMVVGLMIWIAG